MHREYADRNRLLAYLQTIDWEDAEELRHFFSQHCFARVPYFWAEELSYLDVEVTFDEDKKMYYGDWNGRRLYWKRGETKRSVQRNIHYLRIEQLPQSPHRYLLPKDLPIATVADLGAAEGSFALDIIDRVGHVYLFECDPEWEEPLAATFAPWKEKITIVSKYIGRNCDNEHTTLDEYFRDKSLDFIKADIEGAEVDAIAYGKEIMKNKVRAAAICLYHRSTDENDVLSLLYEYGYQCEVNPRHMFFHEGDNPKDWLRRGVVQAQRI